MKRVPEQTTSVYLPVPTRNAAKLAAVRNGESMSALLTRLVTAELRRLGEPVKRATG